MRHFDARVIGGAVDHDHPGLGEVALDGRSSARSSGAELWVTVTSVRSTPGPAARPRRRSVAAATSAAAATSSSRIRADPKCARTRSRPCSPIASARRRSPATSTTARGASVDIARRIEDPALSVDYLRRTGVGGHDHRSSGRHRLEPPRARTAPARRSGAGSWHAPARASGPAPTPRTRTTPARSGARARSQPLVHERAALQRGADEAQDEPWQRPAGTRADLERKTLGASTERARRARAPPEAPERAPGRRMRRRRPQDGRRAALARRPDPRPRPATGR